MLWSGRLRVRHSAVDGEVLVLDHNQEFFEVFMVMRAVGLVDFVSCRVNGIKRIHADAALEAAGRLLAEETLHLDLFDKVIRRLM